MQAGFIIPTDLFATDAAYRLTLSLVHLLWQGIAIGLAALLLARAWRHRSAQARYCVHMAALLAMALCLPLNLLWVAGPDDPPQAPAARSVAEANEPIAEQKAAPAEPMPEPAISPRRAETDRPAQPTGGSASIDPAPPAPVPEARNPRPAKRTTPDPANASNNDAHQLWQRLAPWVVTLYGAGLLAAVFRLLLAYHGGQQLRRAARPSEQTDPELRNAFTRIAERLGLRRLPELGVRCDDVPARFSGVGPVVIGIVRPIVLLPAAAVAQMTPGQIQAVLAHELAHIRRHDPYLMLLQRATETVLFFHPMVWLISRLASVERELACDDLALKAGARPGDYAEALVHLARARSDARTPRPRLAAAVLAMAPSPVKSLEQRLARLFGRRIHHPLRLTRNGLVALAIAGLVGLAALITATRADAPGPYFAQAEVIPPVVFPDPGLEPHPPIPLDVMYVRPDHTDTLYAPTGARLDRTWDDFGATNPIWDEDEALREVIIDLPDDAPHLDFPLWLSRYKPSNSEQDRDLPFYPRLCTRADGSRYILAPIKLDRGWFPEAKRFDLTLAYFAGDQRGPAEIAFQGPFATDQTFNDPTGRHTVSFASGTHDTRINGNIVTRTHHTITIKLNQSREFEDEQIVFYGRDGKRVRAVGGLSYDHAGNPDGSSNITFTNRLLTDFEPRDITRIAIAETPRTTTFRNVTLDWKDYDKPEAPYAPYLYEMADALGRPLRTQGEARALIGPELTLDEAFGVMDVAKNYATRKVWHTLRRQRNTLSFNTLDQAQQARVVAAAKRWIDASNPGVQATGLKIGLWTSDPAFVDAALRLLPHMGGSTSDVMWSLANWHYVYDQGIRPTTLDQLVDIISQTDNDSVVLQGFRLLQRMATWTQPAEQRARVIDALARLARDDKPWVWYSAIESIAGDSPAIQDAQGNDARDTVLPRLAAESDEMLRRCAIVTPDPQLLGQPVPDPSELRLEEVFTPQMYRMVHLGDLFDIHDRWIRVDQPGPPQWSLAIGFLEAMDREWNVQRAPERSTHTKTYLVERIVQHLNASFDLNLGGAGQQMQQLDDHSQKDWRKILREAVAWYRGREGPGQNQQATGHPPIEMEVAHVRAGFSEVLYSADGRRLADTRDDAGGPGPFWDADRVLRRVVVDLPPDTPPLRFIPTQHNVQMPGRPTPYRVAGIRPHMRYRADGSPYLVLDLQIDRDEIKNDLKQLDLTIAYRVADDSGPADLTFIGTFAPGEDFTDQTGRVQTRFVKTNPDAPWQYNYRLSLNAKGIGVWNPEMLAYDNTGRAHRLNKARHESRPQNDGTYDLSLTYEFNGLPPQTLTRLTLNERPRIKTFKNITMHWDVWQDRQENFAFYLTEMAHRLEMPCQTTEQAVAISQKQLTREEALRVIDVVKDRHAYKVYEAIEPYQHRFDELDAAQQAAVRAAAGRWIHASQPSVQEYGLVMAMWAGDITKWDPAIAYLKRVDQRKGGLVMTFLGRGLHEQLGPEHYQDLVDLVRNTHNSDVLYGTMNTFARNSQADDGERLALTRAALIELAHDERPWVWYAAIKRIAGNERPLKTENGELAKWTLIPQLASESDEMLRRCAIVAGDANVLNQPVPEIATLRLEELFNPRSLGMLRFEFRDLYNRWIKTQDVSPVQWALAIDYLDQLASVWQPGRYDYIAGIIVQHLNAELRQDIGGIGVDPLTDDERLQYNWHRIARDAVAWYRANAPRQQREADPEAAAAAGAELLRTRLATITRASEQYNHLQAAYQQAQNPPPQATDPDHRQGG